MINPGFWIDREKADKKIKVLGELRNLLDRYREIEGSLETLRENFDGEKFQEAKKKFRELELESLFNGKYDRQSVVLSVYPGVGGEDAADWARLLLEMYQKYAQKQGWKTAVLDDNPHRRSLDIKGDYTYGYLKNEAGVHRLVRISPFSAKNLRHTSFALVEVVPELPLLEESKMVIPEKDLKFEFYRSSGPGGQNVNKVETAVRAIHLPTGLAASSQAERSQSQNRKRAIKILKAKLFQLMEKEKTTELGSLRAKAKPEWGNQIRSYILNPYKLIKDHRTGTETTAVEKILNGELDKFIESEVELIKN